MPKHLIPLSVAMQSLQRVSHLAAQAWRNVLAADTPEQEANELEWLWQMHHYYPVRYD